MAGDARQEKKRLDKIAEYFSMEEGFNSFMNRYRVWQILENAGGAKTLLDLACADGVMAEILGEYFDKIVAVDGSEVLVAKGRERNEANPNIEFVYSLIEDFHSEEHFDIVLLSFILEHVEDPAEILRSVKSFLNHDGRLIAMVPNAGSLHRRIGQSMGIIKELTEITPGDHKQGHRRVYTLESFGADIRKAGYRVLKEESFFIKPLSNDQMESWDTKICDALYRVSKDVEGLGSMLFIMAEPE